jgi:predicted transcriptional regulator
MCFVIRALTIRQPWAGLIMSGVKDVENRTWFPDPPPDRLIVHAGLKRWRPTADAQRVDLDEEYGALLGTVSLERVIVRATSTWAVHGHWHWVLHDPRPFLEPIPAKGRQGLWTPSDEAVVAALQAEGVSLTY